MDPSVEVFRFLQLPTWLITIAVCSIAVVRGILWVRQAKFSNGNGHVAAPASIIDLRRDLEAEIQTRSSLESISSQMTTVATVLNAAALTLAQIQTRIEHLPSKDELLQSAADTRHLVRDNAQKLLTEVQSIPAEVTRRIRP